MITLRDLGLFSLGATLASMQVSACGDKERAPLAEEVIENEEIPLERLPETTEAFSEKNCWQDIVGYEEQCGLVTVPEAPGSEETIEIGVMRVFSDAEQPAEDPLVYLEGGPGNSVLRNVDHVYSFFEKFAEDRDVIFIDQRGTGVSRPSLSCEGAEDISECFDRVSQQSDPSAFTSQNNARDIDAVRQALGYEKWNLLGISYGTRLALTLMRDFPEGIRAVVIDAVVPLEVDLLAGMARNAESAFEITFSECQQQTECGEKYPDSMEQLIRVTEGLNEEPQEFEKFRLTGDSFVSILFNLLYSPAALSYVPMLIDQADQGEFGLLQDLSFNLDAGDFSFGMHLSVQCAEEFPFTSQKSIDGAEAGVREAIKAGTTGSDYLGYCEDWPVGAAPALENEAVQSKIPTLVLAGRFDPITPPAFSTRVHESLENSYSFLLENESHGSSLGPCGRSLVSNFLTTPGKQPDSSCLADTPDLEFEALRDPRRARRVGRPPSFETVPPTSKQIEQVRDDLRRRLWL